MSTGVKKEVKGQQELKLEEWRGAGPKGPYESGLLKRQSLGGRNPRSFYLLLYFLESYQEDGSSYCQTRFLTGSGWLRTLEFLKIVLHSY